MSHADDGQSGYVRNGNIAFQYNIGVLRAQEYGIFPLTAPHLPISESWSRENAVSPTEADACGTHNGLFQNSAGNEPARCIRRPGSSTPSRAPSAHRKAGSSSRCLLPYHRRHNQEKAFSRPSSQRRLPPAREDTGDPSASGISCVWSQ